jgi:hypothetical protein
VSHLCTTTPHYIEETGEGAAAAIGYRGKIGVCMYA